MSNSKLATWKWSGKTNNYNIRDHKIDKITIHHQAGNLTFEQAAQATQSRGGSWNYAINSNGKIGVMIDEQYRAWTSSNRENDMRAVTIEVANDQIGGNWHVSDKAMTALVNLCVDICKRNGIKKLNFTGDKNGNLTMHRYFAATACLPVDKTELLTRGGWKKLSEIKIGDEVMTAHIDDLSLNFGKVLDVIPEKIQDTWESRDVEATADHRMIYYGNSGKQFVSQFKDLFGKKHSIYYPNAGTYNVTYDDEADYKGLPLTIDEIEYLVAVQADGHYMNHKGTYGVEFHLKKERKIDRLSKLLDRLEYKYTHITQKDGTHKIRLYGSRYVEWCEQWLDNKMFSWKFLNLDSTQAHYFLEDILYYDGCLSGNYYSSSKKQNIDVVQAIAAIHNVGSKVSDDGKRICFKKNKRSIGDNNIKRHTKQKVSCVTVPSGFILIRQHGRTTIVGNCPGEYLASKFPYIASEVNKKLTQKKTTTKSSSPAKKTTTSSSTTKKSTFTPYKVKVTADSLNIRSGAGTKFKVVGSVKKNEIYTIAAESSGTGAKKWGKLKSGAGWISLDYTKRVK